MNDPFTQNENAKKIIDLLDGYYLNKIVFNYKSLHKTMQELGISYCAMDLHGETVKSVSLEGARMQLETEKQYLRLEIICVGSITEYTIDYKDEERTKCIVLYRSCYITPKW